MDKRRRRTGDSFLHLGRLFLLFFYLFSVQLTRTQHQQSSSPSLAQLEYHFTAWHTLRLSHLPLSRGQCDYRQRQLELPNYCQDLFYSTPPERVKLNPDLAFTRLVSPIHLLQHHRYRQSVIYFICMRSHCQHMKMGR